MARTIFEKLAGMPAERRRALVGMADASLDTMQELGPAGAAAAGWGSWACPDYLAAQLGVEYRCPEPAGASEEWRRRCAAAFLKMRI